MRVRAQHFAIKAHGKQRYGPHPYRYHLARVAEAVDEYYAELSGPIAHESLVAAAWLHDTLEDTDTSINRLHRTFGPEVTALVVTLTDVPGKSRAERHARTYPKIRTAGHQAVGLKLCDRIANLRGCRELGNDKMLLRYHEENMDFAAALYRPDELRPLWLEILRLFRGPAKP